MAALLTEAACRARDGDRDGRIDVAYDLLIKCLRTGAEHGLRIVFVDGGPQIFPLLENLHHGPTSSRSLSRREAGVLQMIARGMSNKCIAKSLGITPETVKTHVKAILSKLNARTRAQAVARAETSAFFASVESALWSHQMGGTIDGKIGIRGMSGAVTPTGGVLGPTHEEPLENRMMHLEARSAE